MKVVAQQTKVVHGGCGRKLKVKRSQAITYMYTTVYTYFIYIVTLSNCILNATTCTRTQHGILCVKICGVRERERGKEGRERERERERERVTEGLIHQ